jgi:Mn2+/Fe2+ NRAMP family transporter
MRALVWSGVVQGISVPPLLLLMMLMTNDQRLMGNRVNGPAHKLPGLDYYWDSILRRWIAGGKLAGLIAFGSLFVRGQMVNSQAFTMLLVGLRFFRDLCPMAHWLNTAEHLTSKPASP